MTPLSIERRADRSRDTTERALRLIAEGDIEVRCEREVNISLTIRGSSLLSSLGLYGFGGRFIATRGKEPHGCESQ